MRTEEVALAEVDAAVEAKEFVWTWADGTTSTLPGEDSGYQGRDTVAHIEIGADGDYYETLYHQGEDVWVRTTTDLAYGRTEGFAFRESDPAQAVVRFLGELSDEHFESDTPWGNAKNCLVAQAFGLVDEGPIDVTLVDDDYPNEEGQVDWAGTCWGEVHELPGGTATRERLRAALRGHVGWIDCVIDNDPVATARWHARVAAWDAL